MRKLAEEFLKRIGDYMLVETRLAKADLCLLFGGEQATALADHAADLYHKGYFPLIIVSGGVPTSKGTLECDQMHDRLVARGVPEEAIRVENKATNTGENVLYTMRMLKKAGDFGKIHSVLGIGQIHGSRRFLMTLEKHWPSVTKMFTAPNTFSADRDKWYSDRSFRQAVIREFRKIPKYKARGIISEIDLDDLNDKIARRPQPKPPAPPQPK
ncbi:MAG: YdcF family protein [Alphaproteobacteria bacterium]